jgi:hypothetical protein
MTLASQLSLPLPRPLVKAVKTLLATSYIGALRCGQPESIPYPGDAGTHETSPPGDGATRDAPSDAIQAADTGGGG